MTAAKLHWEKLNSQPFTTGHVFLQNNTAWLFIQGLGSQMLIAVTHKYTQGHHQSRISVEEVEVEGRERVREI